MRIIAKTKAKGSTKPRIASVSCTTRKGMGSGRCADCNLVPLRASAGKRSFHDRRGSAAVRYRRQDRATEGKEGRDGRDQQQGHPGGQEMSYRAKWGCSMTCICLPTLFHPLARQEWRDLGATSILDIRITANAPFRKQIAPDVDEKHLHFVRPNLLVRESARALTAIISATRRHALPTPSKDL